jgi:hypothetical protein
VFVKKSERGRERKAGGIVGFVENRVGVVGSFYCGYSCEAQF